MLLTAKNRQAPDGLGSGKMRQAVHQQRRSIRKKPASPRSTSRHRLASRGSLKSRSSLSQGSRTQPASTPVRARILVIEDDPHAREALTLLLDYYGYDVVAASNGTDGLSLLSEATPDLVVTDWRMPGLSGLALCNALRQRHDTIPIIVVTSAEEVFAQEQPVNARLRKPIDPPLLHQVIREELRGLRRSRNRV